ncbi:MAG: cupin domain-containing protein [Candidatus Rokubacteria bacterium]|nr:cupin domain-containing protein [Candidatus Rokubacteria bacterium]
MRHRPIVAVILIAVLVLVGGAPAQYGGVGPAPAQAQGGPVPLEKGVKTQGLVTSLGGFRGVTNVPIVLTGQIVTIEPGGQTGRQRHMVPSYIYVLEGTLTTKSEGGPVGVGGVQYHANGQSYMDAVAVWHNYTNTGTVPVRYLLLLIATPSAPTLTQKAGADD